MVDLGNLGNMSEGVSTAASFFKTVVGRGAKTIKGSNEFENTESTL